LESNKLPRVAICLAWGSSTLKYLAVQNISVFHQLQTGTLKELDQFLAELLSINSEPDEI
jgi:hypothetical protein